MPEPAAVPRADSAPSAFPTAETSASAPPHAPALGAGTASAESGDENGHLRARTRPEELLERRPDARRFALLSLLLLASLYTLYFARPVLLPIVLAILLSFVLDPIVGLLERLRLPRAIAAGLVLLGLVGATGYGVYRLSGPAEEWIEQAPKNFQELEEKLRSIKAPVEEMGRATEEVERIAQIGEDGDRPTEVRVRERSLGEHLFDRVRKFFSDGVVTLVLLFFLLASGDLFLRKLARVLPTLRAKKRAVSVARHVRSDISTFLLTMSAINLGLALSVGLAMWALGMPNPVLWGVMAGVLNFIPYLGPLVGVVIVALVSLLTFDTIGRAAFAPLAYLALNTIEGSLVTPAIMGRQLSLNPVAIFISLIFWGWIWGIPGALMAVPLVVTMKIVCDHYEPLSAFGEFLGRA